MVAAGTGWRLTFGWCVLGFDAALLIVGLVLLWLRRLHQPVVSWNPFLMASHLLALIPGAFWVPVREVWPEYYTTASTIVWLFFLAGAWYLGTSVLMARRLLVLAASERSKIEFFSGTNRRSSIDQTAAAASQSAAGSTLADQSLGRAIETLNRNTGRRTLLSPKRSAAVKANGGAGGARSAAGAGVSSLRSPAPRRAVIQPLSAFRLSLEHVAFMGVFVIAVAIFLAFDTERDWSGPASTFNYRGNIPWIYLALFVVIFCYLQYLLYKLKYEVHDAWEIRRRFFICMHINNAVRAVWILVTFLVPNVYDDMFDAAYFVHIGLILDEFVLVICPAVASFWIPQSAVPGSAPAPNAALDVEAKARALARRKRATGTIAATSAPSAAVVVVGRYDSLTALSAGGTGMTPKTGGSAAPPVPPRASPSVPGFMRASSTGASHIQSASSVTVEEAMAQFKPHHHHSHHSMDQNPNEHGAVASVHSLHSFNSVELEDHPLMRLLLDDDGLDAFLAYCASEFSGENVLFFASVNDFRESPSIDLAKRIEECFIVEGAPLQVNISWAHRHPIHEQLAAYPAAHTASPPQSPAPQPQAQARLPTPATAEIALTPIQPADATGSATAAVASPLIPISIPAPAGTAASATTSTAAAEAASHTELTLPGGVASGKGVVAIDIKAPPAAADANPSAAVVTAVPSASAPAPAAAPAPIVVEAVGGLPPDFRSIFDKAQREIFRLLESDSFARFRQHSELASQWAHLLTPHPHTGGAPSPTSGGAKKPAGAPLPPTAPGLNRPASLPPPSPAAAAAAAAVSAVPKSGS